MVGGPRRRDWGRLPTCTCPCVLSAPGGVQPRASWAHLDIPVVSGAGGSGGRRAHDRRNGGAGSRVSVIMVVIGMVASVMSEGGGTSNQMGVGAVILGTVVVVVVVVVREIGASPGNRLRLEPHTRQVLCLILSSSSLLPQ